MKLIEYSSDKYGNIPNTTEVGHPMPIRPPYKPTLPVKPPNMSPVLSPIKSPSTQPIKSPITLPVEPTDKLENISNYTENDYKNIETANEENTKINMKTILLISGIILLLILIMRK